MGNCAPIALRAPSDSHSGANLARMRVRQWIACLTLVGAATACGNDDVANGSGSDGATDSDDGSGGETDGPGDTDSDSANSDSDSQGTDDGPMLCSADDECDDGDPCTLDVCNPDGSCGTVEGDTIECRPIIDVEYPPRGATIQAASADEVVTVTGTVSSLKGDITELTLNGEAVTVADDGSFAHDVTPALGGNTLIFETGDTAEQTRRRVQSFLWGTQWVKPTEPVEGMAPGGIAIYFSQEGLDDGDPSEPYNDLASLLGLAFGAFDTSSFFDATTPIASSAGYDIYLTSLDFDDTALSLQAIDGGIALTGSLLDISGDLVFDCTQLVSGCTLAGGDGTGGLTIDSIVIEADVMLSVNPETHELVVDIENTNTTINELDIYSNNWWTDFLLGIAQGAIVGGAVGDLENTLNSQLEGVLAPLLSEGLQNFNFSTTLDFPNIGNPDETIAIDLITDFGDTDFHDGVVPPEPSPPQGGVIVLRGGGFSDGEPAYEGLGFPLRNGCEVEPPAVNLTRTSNMEIGLHDDMINEILYGAWKGGLLQFPLPEDLIPSSPLIQDLVVDISGMLPPVGTDCGETGELLAHLGDIRIDASLTLNDNPISFTAFTSAVVKVELTAQDGEIGISIGDLQSVETELNVNEPSAISAEEALIGVLESALIDGLIGGLGGDALGGIQLPEIDLSGSLGLPPGEAVIAIQIDEAVRQPGITVVQGSL